MIDWCLIMKYYQDIHILDTEGTKFNQIISRVFTSIHHAITAFLAEHEDTKTTDRIALAFPELAERIEQNSLIIGSIIRVFGKDVEAISSLNLNVALIKYRFNTRCTSIKEVPSEHTYAMYKRHSRSKSKVLIKDGKHRHPGIFMKSDSTGQNLVLNIDEVVYDHALYGQYNSFGLSSTATVPKF